MNVLRLIVLFTGVLAYASDEARRDAFFVSPGSPGTSIERRDRIFERSDREFERRERGFLRGERIFMRGERGDAASKESSEREMSADRTVPDLNREPDKSAPADGRTGRETAEIDDFWRNWQSLARDDPRGFHRLLLRAFDADSDGVFNPGERANARRALVFYTRAAERGLCRGF